MTAHPRLDPRTGEMFFFAYSLFAPVPALPRGRRRRRAGAQRRHRPPGAGDDARLRHHRAPRRVPRLADRVQHGDSRQRAHGELEARERHPHRRACPGRARPTTSPGSRSSPDTSSTSGTAGSTATASSSPAPASTRPTSASTRRRPRRVDRRARRPAARLASGSTWPRAPPGWEQFDDLGGDFNRINDDYNGVRTRYLYMSAFVEPGPHHRRLRHHREVRRADRRSHRVVRRRHAATSARACSPPIPTARPRTTAGSSTPCTTTHADATDVVVLDAHDVAARARSPRCTCPGAMPFGFHANWFPAVG